MESLGGLIKQGAGAIEVTIRHAMLTTLSSVHAITSPALQSYLAAHYCPGLEDVAGCEAVLAAHYAQLLELVVEHFFVESSRHVCQAWAVCPAQQEDRESVLTPSGGHVSRVTVCQVHVCRVCRGPGDGGGLPAGPALGGRVHSLPGAGVLPRPAGGRGEVRGGGEMR